MKSYTETICRILSVTSAAIFVASALTTDVGFAQFENQFSQQEATAPMRDEAVQQTDYQRDVHDQAQRMFGQAEPHQTEEPVGDEITRPLQTASQELLQSDSVAPWIDKFKQQTQQIDLPKVLGSLAIVIGGYLGFVWFSRRLVGGGYGSGLPQEVVEVLGETPFGPRKTLQLVRLGSKLLLLMHSPDGINSIGEITDPHEVEYLTSLCGGRQTGRSAIAIRKASGENPSQNNSGDLKHILRQLERSSGQPATSSVFEA